LAAALALALPALAWAQAATDTATQTITVSGRSASNAASVAGFGDVPAVFDPSTKLLSWKVNRRLRTDVCQVSVSWKTMNNKVVATPLLWNFIIDKEAAYQPNGG
jgi:hypothetical protein